MNKMTEPLRADPRNLTEREIRKRLGDYTAPAGLYDRNKARPFVGKVTCNVDRLVAGQWTEIVLDYEIGASGVADGLRHARLIAQKRHVRNHQRALGAAADGAASLLYAGRMPLKRSSLRGVVVGGDAATDPAWVEAAAAAVLPGLRIVVEGESLALPGLEVLAAEIGRAHV